MTRVVTNCFSPSFSGCFQRSLDRVLLDPDLVDLVLIEERLELAIGYRRVLLACLVEALQQR